MFTVSVPAATTALTTLDTVKSVLQITSTDDDSYIAALIDSVTDQVCQYIGVAAAGDGTRHLGRETVIETIRASQHIGRHTGGRYGRRWGYHEGYVVLMLSRSPVTAVATVVEDGVTTDPSDYEIDGAAGILRRLSDDVPIDWYASKIVVTYAAGWLLPGDDGRTLPIDLEGAVVDLVKGSIAARTRDPALKLERMLQRTYEYEVFPAETDKTGGLPADVAAVLDRYKTIYLG